MSETVSVIIPVYNGERFLAEAIQSVLDQTPVSAEIIVVDDGSTDETAAVVRQLGRIGGTSLRYEYQINRGPSAARNRGLQLAQADLIAFLDADDLWDKAKLGVQCPLLLAQAEIRAVWGNTQTFRIVNGQRVMLGEPFLSPQLGSALFRRAIFEEVGLFDETMRYSEDLDWFLRARDAGVPSRIHSEIAVWYRYHGDNTWLGRPDAFGKTLWALKKRLDRHRAAPTKPSDVVRSGLA